MSSLVETTADLAAWLAEHVRPELPPLAEIRVTSDFGDSFADLQLPSGYGGVKLTDLADWAEHLGTCVLVKSGHTADYVRAEIIVALRHGQPLRLWNHLKGRDRAALEATGTFDALESELSVTAAGLRQAAERRVG